MSSHLDGYLRQVDHQEVRKLSANSIVRLLKTELAPTGDPLYALVTIKQAFATSLHIKHNLDDKWDMLEESPLDTYDPEHEYVMAERDAVPQPPRTNPKFSHGAFNFVSDGPWFDTIGSEFGNC
ncbi:hypothetical protein EYR41_010545 [Orbilia oligospora]|uniref:Uncharacterized protein n=1 Tax=Orbilia oligospora TaxID=2813651 RepID=A0A7C8TSG0_ORBOL|nr:hypothetical protein TWF751_000978 [Orbilia oligospora]TGJ64495.1 hypothetical protein EYR41_010545 [Orbilia oligospora]